MSRALARLRETIGDPLLVRAGRSLVPTPRALALREQAHQLLQDVDAVLRPEQTIDLARLTRTFTLRTSDGFVESFGPGLIARVGEDAPGVRLHFLQKPDKDSGPLRDGRVDLETGVVESSLGPEVRTQALFRDRLIGVVRAEHPLGRGAVTTARYLAERHVQVSRSGFDDDAVDQRFLPPALKRRVAATIVSGFLSAASRPRCRSRVSRTWWRRFRTGIRRTCATDCTRSPCRPPRWISRCRCSGIPGWTAIRRTAGCEVACAKSAPRPDRGCQPADPDGPGAA